jgi:acyl-homoserine lactone acylase PvdQ
MFRQWSVRTGEAGPRYAAGGSSYVAVVEFGEEVKARSLVPFGQSADPDSPHFVDQAPRMASGDFKTAWFTLEEVRAHAVLVEPVPR